MKPFLLHRLELTKTRVCSTETVAKHPRKKKVIVPLNIFSLSGRNAELLSVKSLGILSILTLKYCTVFCNGRNKVWICEKKGAAWSSWTLICIVSKTVTLLIVPSLKEENQNHLSEDIFLCRTWKRSRKEKENNYYFTLSQQKAQLLWLLQAFLKHMKKCSWT